ncbi:AAA domain-containing protein [Fulvivirgaceae bacterium BMA12]|uniref:AAA domain-containing protein n=1 Tax=Agaribacillus aureus TaxID=3051825 RepID=A0ABT8LED0_9BACT|nr:AAA domain-containing protein [Fulvivirgaceae bacterium BMA12]
MSFSSYLIRKYEFSHENQYFRKFSWALNEAFRSVEGEHILIGNISCGGHQIDAIFIARGQITVIDFKDYAGDLTFSENNPWRMKTPEGGLVFVQGGAQSRNPFQQVRAYRFSLAEILEINESKILEGAHENVKWIHTGCIVQFHHNVSFDQSSIPSGITRYFHITDNNSAIELLKDLYSKGLELTDNEIRSILKVLDVSEDNLLENHSFDIEEEKSDAVGATKLAMIKRLSSGRKEDSEFDRVLNYYKTLINVEKFKEPLASQLHAFPFNQDKPINEYPVNIAASEEFHQLFLTNMKERFPRNLFVGLDIIIDGQNVPVLHTIILASDISDMNDLTVNFDEFEIYSNSLEKMGLTEDVIEELTTAVNDSETLGEKLSCIREHLSVSAEMTSRVLLGLSTESLFSAQLLSEFGKLSKLPEDLIENPLFKSFLSNKTIIQNGENNLLLDPFVQVTDLNESQTKAVELSFDQPLTVITGPPGTGKSQIVMNIIANAVVNGHSVLFASKNNKAVDNVKERLDEIIENPYLLRFGSKNEIENTAIPQIMRQVSQYSQGVFEDKTTELTSAKNEVNTVREQIKYLKTQITLIPKLQIKISRLKNELAQRQIKLDKWLVELEPIHRLLFIEKKTNVGIDVNEVGLLIQKIKNWNSGFLSKILFKWFHKSKLEQSLRKINDSLSLEVKEYISEHAPWATGSQDLLSSGFQNLNFLLELKKSEKRIIKKHNDLLKSLTSTEEDISSNSENLKHLESSKEEYESEIAELTKGLPSKCSDLLNLMIQQRLNDQNISNTQRYQDYLPANNVWKDEEVADFSDSATRFLQDFNAICLTSLSVKNSFPLTPALADVLVIDEASQCDIASAIPMILRAKRAVIIGDPLQLRHITSVQKYEQDYVTDLLGLEKLQLDYVNKSLYDYSFKLATKSGLESVFLQEHYRCHPEIIEFSNQHFYERRLGQTMLIKTNSNQFQYGDIGINWIHVNGEMHSKKNINSAEINKSIELVKLLATQYPNASIGIVTPFRDQYKELFSKLPQELLDKVKVDTVHKYQGDEKDIIIFSPVISDNATVGKAMFLSRNEYLINVAITRAKSALYIVGNFDYCKKIKNGKVSAPLSQLATYTENLNKVLR